MRRRGIMSFRKVSAKENSYLKLKNKHKNTYDEFMAFIETEGDAKNSKTSGKARSYTNYLFFMAVIYEETFEEEIGNLSTNEGLEAINNLKNLEGFTQYNVNENGFPNSTFNSYRKYIGNKTSDDRNRGEMMAYNKEASKNLDIYTDILAMKKESQILYETENFIVLSPAIQSNREQSRFDIFEKVANKVISSNKPGILAIRYFEDILVADIELFKMHLTREDCIVYGSKTPKREYSIKNKNGQYLVKLVKAPKEVPLDLFDRNRFIEYLKGLLNKSENIDEKDLILENIVDVTTHISDYIKSKGFLYSEQNIKNLYLSLRSKPFVILSGISGTGKTKIVQLFAEAVCATRENGQFKLIPVRPDWSDSSDLIGYKDIKNEFIKGPLTEIIMEASQNIERPYFVVLDEMNLARVEYYLSDFLSVVESRDWKDGKIETAAIVEFIDENGELQKYGLPENLYIIGTVNMDETTHPFSKKVLDRANSIEFNEVHLTSFSMFAEVQEQVQPVQVSNDLFKSDYLFLKDVYEEHTDLVKEISNELEGINNILVKNYAQVGYRVRDEIAFYMAYHKTLGLLERDEAMDFCIMQKILPRLTGAGDEIREVLIDLLKLFIKDSGSNELEEILNDKTKDVTNYKLPEQVKPYPKSAKKVYEMLMRLASQGFVSYWSV